MRPRLSAQAARKSGALDYVRCDVFRAAQVVQASAPYLIRALVFRRTLARGCKALRFQVFMCGLLGDHCF